ncbi:SDR family oxidoreductase [Halomontanus rarus]|uniref:SDR family NAD(P)-dependent oxidoreductase n=1 Tax=Halomontanus rarus TaxID=3034020 RepID=UPI00307BA47D
MAIVTGGGAHTDRVFGIGEATCLRLAEEGANVIVVDLEKQMAQQTVDRIEQEGYPQALAVEADLTDEHDIAKLASICETEFNSVDILVNSAGMRIEPSPVTESDSTDWQSIFEVNLKGVADCCKHIIPQMAESGGGSIVNISSANAVLGRKNWALYDATKAGVLGLTRDLACDHADQEIRVNAVLPGPTVTDYHLQGEDDSDIEALIEDQTSRSEDGPGILKRLAKPRELANAILFLASEESSFVTGTEFRIDGGLTAAGYDV